MIQLRASELQTVRRTNLRLLLNQLKTEGIQGRKLCAMMLGMTPQQFADIVDGAEIDDTLARSLEWAMNRPRGWMDRAFPDRIW